MTLNHFVKTNIKWVVCGSVSFAFLITVEVALLNRHNQEIYEEMRATASGKFLALRQKEDLIHYNYFTRGLTNTKVLTLTFDDGPYPDHTPKILAILKQKKVKATFFIVGLNADKHPEIIWQMIEAGHEVGNHTYYHSTFAFQSVQDWQSEIERANASFTRIVGSPPRWFRAPGCRYTVEALEAIESLKMVRVDTSNNGFDYDQHDAATVLRTVLSQLKSGDVVLLHDSDPVILNVLPKFIDEVRIQGYQIVPLLQLMEQAQERPEYEPPYCPPQQGIRLPTDTDPNSIQSATKIDE